MYGTYFALELWLHYYRYLFACSKKFNFGFIIILLHIIDNYVTQVVLAYMYYVSTYIFLSIYTHDGQN